MDVRGLAVLWSSHRGPRPGPTGKLPGRRWATRILLIFLALDLAIGAFFGGRALAQGLPGLDPRVAGALLWRLPLSLGLAGALWEGGCIVDPVPFRPLFLQDRTLVLGEFLLGLTTPAKALLGGLGGIFSLGLATVHPALLPGGLWFNLLALFWVVCLERVLHALGPARFLGQRAFLLLLGVLGGALVGLRHLAGGAPLLGGALLGPLERAWSLPGVRLIELWQGALAGKPRAPLGAWVLPILATGALGLLTWASILREFRAGRPAPSGLGSGRTWALARPWLGVAWIQFHQILGSRAGQMRLLVLLLSVLLAKEPELISIGHLQSTPIWMAAAGAITFGAVLIVPLCNLMGFDRGGVRTWWLLPIQDRELWLGKVLGTAAYAGLALLILLALLVQTSALRLRAVEGVRELDLRLEASTHPLGAGQVVALAVLLGILFLWWAGSGLRRSRVGAWPMGLSSYGVQLVFDDEKLARMGVMLAPVVWMLPLFGLGSHFGPWALFPGLGLLGFLTFLRFSRKLDEACLDLAEGREALTAALLQTR